MKKILILMVAMMVIGGMVFATEPPVGTGKDTGTDAEATLVAKLDLKNADNDLIEVGFSADAVSGDNVSTVASPSTSLDMDTDINGEKTHSQDVYAYWIIRSSSNLDVKLSLTDGLTGLDDEATISVAWNAALSDYAGEAGKEETVSIANGSNGVIADHNGATDYASTGSVKLALTTDGFSALTTAGTLYGTVTLNVVAGN